MDTRIDSPPTPKQKCPIRRIVQSDPLRRELARQ